MPLKRGEEEEGLPLNKIPSKQYQRKEYTNIEEPQLNSSSFITERVMACAQDWSKCWLLL
jgi:hypothetical protein